MTGRARLWTTRSPSTKGWVVALTSSSMPNRPLLTVILTSRSATTDLLPPGSTIGSPGPKSTTSTLSTSTTGSNRPSPLLVDSRHAVSKPRSTSSKRSLRRLDRIRGCSRSRWRTGRVWGEGWTSGSRSWGPIDGAAGSSARLVLDQRRLSTSQRRRLLNSALF